MNMAVTLKATLRNDLRKSITKQLRQEGQVPAIVYGKGEKAKTISVDSVELLKTVRDEGRNAIISLNVEGDKPVQVMVHEYQSEPLKNELLHVDFYEVDLSEEMTVNVPVRVEGEVKGGIVQQPLYELQVKAKPSDIPEEITVEVSSLSIGDSISVDDLPTAANYEIMDEGITTVVTILAPESEVESTEEVDEDAEPELVGSKQEEANEE